MKTKINYKSRRTIIITAVAIGLLIAAIAGTTAFIKGNQSSTAAMTENRVSQPQVEENVTNNGSNEITQSGGSEVETNNNEITSPQESENTTNQINSESTNNNIASNGNTTSSSNLASSGNTAVPSEDYTQTTVIPGRENVLVYKNTQIGWMPITIPVYTENSDLQLHKPILESEKFAYLDGDSLESLPVNTAIQKGETITYVIKVSNKGNEDVKNIRTLDNLPEGTTLVQDSITEGGIFSEGKIAWKNDIKAGETITLTFKVTVNEEAILLVNNQAKVDGENTTETKNPIITSAKTDEVVTICGNKEVLEVRDAKVGETIRYTITVKNTSEVEAKTIIKDSIPDGTALIKINDENGSLEGKTITWKDVIVPANSEVKVSFDVTVNEKTEAGETVKYVKNTATVGNTDTPPAETKVANIKTVKTSEGSNSPLHELDTITYKLTVTNYGEGTGTVKIADTVPEGTTLVEGSIKLDDTTYSYEELVNGIEVTLQGNETKTITFKVTINPFEAEKITITNDEARQDGNEIPETNDEVEKEYVTINVNKNFKDNEEVNYRPTTVLVGLFLNGKDDSTMDTRMLDSSNNWSASFEKLNKYELITKELIDYEVREIQVDDDYVPTVERNSEGNTITFYITNTIKYENVRTSISARKVWNDNIEIVNARQDVVFELYKDGEPTGETQLATSEYGWKVDFADLQKYHEDGTKIEYTVKEITDLEHFKEPEYSMEGSTLIVTNTIDYNTFKKDIPVTKKWVDPKNTTHNDITVVLLQNGVEYKTETIKANTTTCIFKDLPVYNENGEAYTYTVKELEVEGYKSEISKENPFEITNTIIEENINISGTKTWIDPAGTTHENITIKLFKNSKEVDHRILKEGELTYSFENLPKYKTLDNGAYDLDENGDVKLNEYAVTEDAISGYVSSSNVTQTETGKVVDFTNTIEPDYISVSGTKTWIDPVGTNHQDITIKLLKNGEEIAHKILKNGELSYAFENLPKYKTLTNGQYELDENGNVKLNEYTVIENPVSGYTQSSTTTETEDEKIVNFTNTIEQKEVSVSGTKTWVDPDGTTHQNITINLLRDGVEIDSRVLKNGELNYSFEGLPKYDLTDGHIYEYIAKEEAVPGYDATPTVTENGVDFTNTIKQENTVKISGMKTWIAPSGTVYPDITIRLFRNGTEIDHKILKNGELSYSFSNLPKYDLITGEKYIYTVEEEKVEGYNSISTITANGVNFKNIIEQKEVSISGTKTWIDPEGTVHEDITIRLYRDGVEIDSKILKNGELNYSFTNLPKYDLTNGHVYNYEVKEDAVLGYNSSSTVAQTPTGKTINFTNTIKQEKVTITGTKKWIDPEGTIHKNITIKLYRDGVEIDNRVLKNGELNYSFTNLPKYDLTNGHEYKYEVKEDAVPGYTQASKVTETTTGKTVDFTNTIEQKEVSVSGTKTWLDPVGTTHQDITIKLYRDGVEIEHRVLKNGDLSYSFTGLPKYDLTNGHVYNYEVKEDAVPGYTQASKVTETTTGKTVDFTNTIEQKYITISGTKTWVDPVGVSHPKITIRLFRNGTEIDKRELTNGSTIYNFGSLPKYDLTNGHEYKYEVKEDAVPGYNQASKVTETTTGKTVDFTNTIEQKEVSISGTKTWVDPAGTTHKDITIRLYRDKVEIDHKVLKNGDLSYSFTGLPKYDLTDGHEYKYTAKEDAVPGYTSIPTTTTEGVDFKNVIQQVYDVEVNGTKTWKNVPKEMTTSPAITIRLYRDGTEINRVTLENGKTSYSFKGLPRYDLVTGKEYVYTVKEDPVKNFDTTYEGYNITNTFNQEVQGTVEITTITPVKASAPLDVVFVLDVSGSMDDDYKDKKMVDAVNNAISTVMENTQNRVGVIAYSAISYKDKDKKYDVSNSTNATTLLGLSKYTATNNKYLQLNQKGYYSKDRDGWYHTISTNVNEQASKTVNVYGGTFTQAGIKLGAEMLSKETTTTAKVTMSNGEEKEVTRTPILILLSDGKPTFYSTDSIGLTGSREGNGNSTTADEAFYTIKTAHYYKQEITKNYYGTTKTKSKFYTIGLGDEMKKLLAKTIMDPSAANVNDCNTNGGSGKKRNEAGQLYDAIIKNGGSAGSYSYADKYFPSDSSEEELKTIFNKIIEDNSTSTDTRNITLEEINQGKIYLTGINTSKEFLLVINGKTYSTFSSAYAAQYVKGNSTDGYYVDISTLAKGSKVRISYNK